MTTGLHSLADASDRQLARNEDYLKVRAVPRDPSSPQQLELRGVREDGLGGE